MKVAVPKEIFPGENRVSLVPETVGRLVKMGCEVEVESGLGVRSGFADADYTNEGAGVTKDRTNMLASADIVLHLRKPDPKEIVEMRKGAIHISYLDPFNEKSLVKKFASAGISAISMEMIPRTTIAQKMDALSSQANLSGYVAVTIAAERLNKIFPMMMTPSGTISPARVFVIGAGVAGLQAIATAKRLGARVEAFDTRPVVSEQVQSLGARFVKIDLGETGQTKDGYAKQLTEAQIKKQREAMAKHCASADVVITTAQVFGRKAPLIVTKDMIKGMKPGSVVVDLAVETGGNVEGSRLNEEVNVNGVKIIGFGNLPGKVAPNASQMYSNNIEALLEELWDAESKEFKLDFSNEIVKGCVVTCQGKIVNEQIRKVYEGGQ